jgi:hypothetical protein
MQYSNRNLFIYSCISFILRTKEDFFFTYNCLANSLPNHHEKLSFLILCDRKGKDLGDKKTDVPVFTAASLLVAIESV